MITFVEFLELCESSTGESGRRRVSSRGPSANMSDRNKQRQDNSNRAALSKAGFSRSPRPVTGKGGRKTKWTETSTSSHHSTETGTYANQSDYATTKIGNLGPKGNKPTSKRALKAKQVRKQLGGDRTPRQVHDVAVNKKRTYDDDNSSTMTKGRSFRKEVTKGVSDNLKKAGAKSGDIVTSTPTSDSRSRMYGKTHNTKTSKRTGTTVNRIREYFSILEVNRPESGSDKEKVAWDKQKARRDALEDPSSMFIGTTGRDNEGNRKYGLKSSERKKEQGKRRGENLKSLSQKELEDHAKRNLHPSPAKTARRALRIERGRKKAQRDDATTRTQQTGQQYDVDHIQGQPNRRSAGFRSRFQKIHPGDASDNRQVMHGDKNRTKNSKNTQTSTTRAGAVRAALMRARG